MFSDVSPESARYSAVGDLGIREAIKRLYSLETRPNAAKMEEIAAPWRPFRTLASRYLWKSLEIKNDAV
jgi:DNA-3-methyladenine glycosylase II